MSPYCLNPFSGPQCTPVSWSGPFAFPVSSCTIFAFSSCEVPFLTPLMLTCLPSQGLGTQFPLMLPSSASFPLTTTPSNLSSSATSSGSCPRLPCSVTFCLGLLGHCQAPLVSTWGQQQGSGGFGWGLAGYYVPIVHSVQASCIILGSCRLPKSCLSKALCLEGW